MAVSGQISEQSYPIYKITEMAIRRATAAPAAIITAEMAQVARDHLFLMQSAWAANGVNLWCQEKLVLGLYPNVGPVTTPVGTIDVLNATFRKCTRPTGTNTSSAGGTADNAFDGDVDTVCTQTSALGNLKVDYGSGSDQIVVTAGYLPGATATLALVYEYSTDDVTWTTAYTADSAAYTDGVWVWQDMPAPFEARYFRCRATSGTLVVRELYFGTSPSEIVVARLNRDDYVGQPSKQSVGDITSFWLDRARDRPVMYLWPVPSSTFNQLVVWRHRYIMDPGTAQNDADVPQRWLDAVVKGLAARMAMELPGVDMGRVPILERQAQEALNFVGSAEYDNSPINLIPDISVYSR